MSKEGRGCTAPSLVALVLGKPQLKVFDMKQD